MRLFVALLTLATLVSPSSAQSAADLAAAPDAAAALEDPLATVIANVVQVRAYRNENLQTAVSGFAVNDRGLVLTSGHALRRADRFTVIYPEGEAEIVARLVWRDEATDSALLEARGLAAAPLVFGVGVLEQGRNVIAAWRWESDRQLQTARGSLGAAPGTAPYEHNAMITADGYGAPLLNECGQVVGINRKDPASTLFFATRDDDPEGVVHAAAAPVLSALLTDKGVAHEVATTVCTPREQVVQAEAAAATEQARRQAEEAQRRADVSEREKAELRRIAEEKEQAAREAEERAQQLEQAERQARREAERHRKYLYIGAAAAAALALVVLFFFIRRNRTSRRRVAAAEARAYDAERIVQAQEQAPDARPGWSFSSESGADSFYISRAVLESAAHGVRIGRNPDSCNYVIPVAEVSREHCRVFLDDGRLMLEDLKSANGTNIGTRRLQAHAPEEIRDGERIVLGGAAFRIIHIAE